jgi:hypothetical protein
VPDDRSCGVNINGYTRERRWMVEQAMVLCCTVLWFWKSRVLVVDGFRGETSRAEWWKDAGRFAEGLCGCAHFLLGYRRNRAGSTPSFALPDPHLLHALLDPSRYRPVTRFILSHFFFVPFTFALRLPFVATTRLIALPDLFLNQSYPEPPWLES